MSDVPGLNKLQLASDISVILPQSIMYRLQLAKIHIEALNVIMSCSHGERAATMNVMIASFDDRVCAVPLPRNNTICMFHLKPTWASSHKPSL